MASAFVAGKMASEPEVAEEEAGRSLQDLHKRVHFSASLRFRLHQVAGSYMNGVVAERLEFAVFLSPFTLWANVAQLVEQRFRKARVVSSILTVGSTSNPHRTTVKPSRNPLCPYCLSIGFNVWQSDGNRGFLATVGNRFLSPGECPNRS